MKKTIKLAVVAALALGATSAFATNGALMIGQGAKSRSMGGVGIATAFGAQSAIANPANISSTTDSEATLAVTVFTPDVSFKSGYNGATGDYKKSGADLSVIPEIYYSKRLSDKLVVGLAIAGTAGMGVDYDNDIIGAPGAAGPTSSGTDRMKTALSILKVVAPISYTTGGLTLGAAGVFQYGTLEMSHGTSAGFLDNGPASDVGYGLELGATYTKGGLTLGAVYKSKISMIYADTISTSLTAFGSTITSGDKLDQPEERGVGISYTMGANTIAADYKKILWADASGYSDFGWEDQDVYSVGYEYATASWALRAGYNYAKSPISDLSAAGTDYQGSVKNFMVLAGFPGVVETHYTFGAGYNVTDSMSLNAAVVYAPEVTNTYALTGNLGAEASVKHSQTGITIAATYTY